MRAPQSPGGLLKRRASLPPGEEIVDDAGIGQGRRVAEPALRTFRNLAQDAPHDLAGSGLGQRWREVDFVRGGERADVLADLLVQLFSKLAAALFAGDQRYERIDGLPLDVVRIGDHGRLGDLWMRHERAFHLGGADTVPGNVDHVVDAAGNPVIAILVTAAAVACEVEAGIGLEVGFEEPPVVVPYGAHLPRP